MIESKRVEIKIKEVGHLADLRALEVELDMAMKLCDRARKIQIDTNDDAIFVDGLVTAALVKYVRCFQSTGKRYGLSLENIESLPKDFIEAHNYLKDLRDKHVAHSVNGYEHCYVSAYIEIEDGVRKPFTALMPGSERVILGANEAFAIYELSKEVSKIVVGLRIAEERRVLAIVNSLPEEVIATFKPYEEINPEMEAVKKPRKDTYNPRKKNSSQ